MPPKHTTTATSFLARDAHLSIELSKLAMDPIEVKTHIDKFKHATATASTQSFVKLIHNASNGAHAVKMKVFGSNQTSMFNEDIKTFQLDGVAKLIGTKATPIAAVPQMASSADIVRRFAFELTNYSNWMLHIDLVKSLTNPLDFNSKLPSAKTLLVDIPLEQMLDTAYDYVLTTLVRINHEPITYAEVVKLIEDITDSNESPEAYQQAIYSLAKDIFRDAITITQFKTQSGFKRLCSNTVELSRSIYFKQVLPVIDTFYLTDKMDGTRAMLVIDEVYRRSGHRRHLLGADIKAVSDQVYTIQSFDKPSASTTIEVDHTVLDVEMMFDGKNRIFHCFDIIALASRRFNNSPFKDRYAKFDAVSALLEKYELGSVKEFVKLTKDGFKDQIKSFYDKKRSYHIDGLVFTPQGTHFKDAIKERKSKFDRVFNTDYANTISFKWKPLDQLTIDFYLMQHPQKKGSYVMCSGVDTKTFAQLQLELFDGYVAPVAPNAHRYFPIQFDPYDKKFNNVWTPTKQDFQFGDSFDGMVGEFTFADSSGVLERPQLIRLRTDRVQDIAKGEYYGNALKYAELIYHSIKYPLTIESMCDPTDKGYFAATDDNDWFKAQRNFNSFVKTWLMEMHLLPKTDGSSRMMDIACGKGQDLARAIDLGYDEIIAMDKDTDAIYELLERKYNLRVKRKGATANIHIKNVDLEESSEHTIKALNIKPTSVDAAMINFAIHYICHSAGPEKLDPITEFVKLVGYYLKSGAHLMITAFNGKDIFDALGKNATFTLKENDRVKYSIKKAFSSDTLTNLDQAIDVLLPFSGDGIFYREYLVNYDFLQSVFEANGFKLIRTESFESFLRAYKKENLRGYQAMSQIDKDWVSLYGYLIFERV